LREIQRRLRELAELRPVATHAVERVAELERTLAGIAGREAELRRRVAGYGYREGGPDCNSDRQVPEDGPSFGEGAGDVTSRDKNVVSPETRCKSSAGVARPASGQRHFWRAESRRLR
jgi:hypothetical protein